jgi:hypothetical protein
MLGNLLFVYILKILWWRHSSLLIQLSDWLGQWLSDFLRVTPNQIVIPLGLLKHKLHVAVFCTTNGRVFWPCSVLFQLKRGWLQAAALISQPIDELPGLQFINHESRSLELISFALWFPFFHLATFSSLLWAVQLVKHNLALWGIPCAAAGR